jgi:hypothetical protein
MGHFNVGTSAECSKCAKEGRGVNAKERYLVATTDAKRRELMDFVAGRELERLEQPILHPSTSVLERTEAAEQALRPDEEILEA